MKKLGVYIVFYIILIPISLIPLWILYRIGSFISFILYRFIGYRKEVIERNLKKSFPSLDNNTIESITINFYKHLGDLLIEGLKMLTITRSNLLKRYKCINPQILDSYFKEGKSIILVSGHYNNWEYMVASLSLQFNHHAIGVGKRMSNKYFEKLMHNKRTRFGTEVCYADNTNKTIEKYNRENIPCAYMLLADQSPNDRNKCYWTEFLNQDTPVIYGPEYLAKKYNYPIFYYRVNKTKRGYYSFEIIPINDNPIQTNYGDITKAHIKLLEESINTQPPFWLWSHKRWKLSATLLI